MQQHNYYRQRKTLPEDVDYVGMLILSGCSLLLLCLILGRQGLVNRWSRNGNRQTLGKLNRIMTLNLYEVSHSSQVLRNIVQFWYTQVFRLVPELFLFFLLSC